MNFSEAEVVTREVVALIDELGELAPIVRDHRDFRSSMEALEKVVDASRELRRKSSALFEFLDEL